MKNIYLMSLYQAQPCLQEEPFMMIQQVKNQREKRLTMTKGNVNFTDYWFATVDASTHLGGKFIGQHFSLLKDEKSWEQGHAIFEDAAREHKYIGVALIKIRSAIGIPLDAAQNRIEEEMKERKICGRIYRTFDNADFILFLFDKEKSRVIESLVSLREICYGTETIYYSFYSLTGQFSEVKKIESVEEGAEYKNENFEIRELEWHDEYLIENHGSDADNLCKKVMEMLWDRVGRCKKERNVKWLSYYQALYQIINLLKQYEEGQKFKDLYYIFFPALQLFIEQLDEGMKKIENDFGGSDKKDRKTDKNKIMKKTESAVSNYIDSMEGLIYHTGVSCANILNVEGRNGMPYDVSIRLCMMYMSALHLIVKVLNDTNYKYEFCLLPLAYSTPRTNVFDFGLEPGDRLIRVQISRQQMLSPRALLAILAHEGSHYIGNFRKRKERAGYFITIAALLFVEELLPAGWLSRLEDNHKLTADEREIFDEDVRERKKKLVGYLQEQMKGGLKERNADRRQPYHLKDLCQDINDIIAGLFQKSCQDDLICIMDTVTDKLKEKLCEGNKSEKIISAYEAESNKFRENLMCISVLNNVLEKLLQVQKNFKEIVADLGAILLLDLEPCYYLETFLLSESYVPGEDMITDVLTNRVAVVHRIMCKKDKRWKEEWRKLDQQQFNDILFPWALKQSVDKYNEKPVEFGGAGMAGNHSTVRRERQEEWYEARPFQMEKIVEIESSYLEKCYEELYHQIKRKEAEEPLKLLRNIYRHFKVYECGQEPKFSEFFDDLKKLTDCYKKSVKEIYGKDVPVA